jgi:hypothetical protein
MEEQISANPSEVSTEVAVSTPEITQSSEIAVKGSESDTNTPEITQSTEIQPWTPNYKVKAYDSEFDIPETYHGYINEKNEKEFRQLFSKAYGLDVMKEKNDKLRSQNEVFEKSIKEKYEPLEKGVARVSRFLENKDFGSFFDALKINVEDLQKWMLRELQLKDLPPEQQEIYNNSKASQRQLYELEQQAAAYKQQLEGYQSQSEQQAISQRSTELDQVLASPSVKSLVEKFDAKNQVGAFRNEVLQRAAFIAQTKGVDLSAEQAVQEVLKLVSWNQEQQAQKSPDETVLSPKENSKPTLPTIAGKTKSPAAQKVKTLDDLYKLKAQAIKNMQSEF